MKRLALFVSVLLLGGATLAPAAFANRGRQLSTPQELSETATITDLVRHNRDSRSNK